MRILNYAVNGLGLGHLTRLIAINRQLRRLTSVLDVPAEILFLTSSEADSLAYQHGFAAFKIPSRTVIAACQMDAARYRKIAKQWVWNAVNLCSPDILIVDTFPAGSFHELYDVLDFGQKNVFIYRAVRPEMAGQSAFQSALRGYDRIIQPLEQGENDSPVPEEIRHRVVTVGEILLRSSAEIAGRAEAREMLGIAPEAFAVYASTGGGGDVQAETLLKTIVESARLLPSVHFVIAAGPLYRGREFPLPNVAWSYRPAIMQYFRAFDVAVTAGGFNSVWELMHCGVPCLFLPQPRSHDDQHRRVARCVAAGAGVELPVLTPEVLADALIAFHDPVTREKASQVARSLVPVNQASAAAEAILELVYPANKVEVAALLCDVERIQIALAEGLEENVFLEGVQILWKNFPALVEEDEADALCAATRRYLRVSVEMGVNPTKALRTLRKLKAGATPDDVVEQAIDRLQMAMQEPLLSEGQNNTLPDLAQETRE